MVALRSRREDRTLLVAAWVLAVTVLVLGVVAVAPILIIWGVLGVGAAVFATRIHLRDTRARQTQADSQTQAAQAEEPAGGDRGSTSVQADAVEQEHVR